MSSCSAASYIANLFEGTLVTFAVVVAHLVLTLLAQLLEHRDAIVAVGDLRAVAVLDDIFLEQGLEQKVGARS